MIKVTFEKTYSSKPENARRCLSMLSCIDGAKSSAAQIIEKLDDSGAKTIRIPFVGDERHLLDQIRDVVLQNDDYSESPLFDRKSEPTVGDRVLIGKPLKGDSDIYEGREGVVLSIADEVDVRFDLGYSELSGLFPMERIEVIPQHELQEGDVVRTVTIGGDSNFGTVNRIDDDGTIQCRYASDGPFRHYDMAFDSERDSYIRPSRLCVGDAVIANCDDPNDADGMTWNGSKFIIDSFEHDSEPDVTWAYDAEDGNCCNMKYLTLDLDALAIRVEEQEELVAAAERAAQEPAEREFFDEPTPGEDDNINAAQIAELQNPTHQPISEVYLDKAMALYDMEERINPELLHRTYQWPRTYGLRVIERLRELGRIPVAAAETTNA